MVRVGGYGYCHLRVCAHARVYHHSSHLCRSKYRAYGRAHSNRLYHSMVRVDDCGWCRLHVYEYERVYGQS